MKVDIVFDGPPGPESGRFVEVESPPGTGIKFGEWVHRDDGYWVLRFAAEKTTDEPECKGCVQGLPLIRGTHLPPNTAVAFPCTVADRRDPDEVKT